MKKIKLETKHIYECYISLKRIFGVIEKGDQGWNLEDIRDEAGVAIEHLKDAGYELKDWHAFININEATGFKPKCWPK